MNATRSQHDIPGLGSVDISFADAAARSELTDHLPMLCLPGEHVGGPLEQVKANPSRTVYRCLMGGRHYYLKHYHSTNLWHRMGEIIRGDDAHRELRLSRYLRSRDIAAIEVLAAGRQGRQCWMISRTVANAAPASEWHDARATSPDRATQREIRRTGRAVAVLIGRMHAAGVLHHDLHSGNILLSEANGRFMPKLTDLHRAQRRRRLSRLTCAKNLAQLAHDRRHVTTRSERLRFLKHYIAARGGQGSLRGWAILVDHFAAAHTGRLYAQHDRRVTGRNRYFAPVRLTGRWRGHVVLASKRQPAFSKAAGMVFSTDAWRIALADPDALLDVAADARVKDSPRCQVVRRTLNVAGNEIDVYVKRHRHIKWYKIVEDVFRRSRAFRAFRSGHALITRRIDTALPLAAIQRRTWGVLRSSILITETVAPAAMLNHDIEAMAAAEPSDRRDFIEQIGRFLRRLHDHGFAHRDLKAANVLVWRSPDAVPHLVLIDLDGLSLRRRVPLNRRLQGLMRINVAMVECPSVSRADRLRCLLAYLRHRGCGRIAFKPYWRLLEQWTDRKLARKANAKG